MNRSFISICMLLMLARIGFGVLFLWAAFGKIVDPDRFALQVARYEIASPQASAIVGLVLPWCEFIVGSCLLVGVWSAGAWLGSIALFGCFVFARLSVLHRGLSIECGCGVMDGTITPRSVIISFALLLIAVAGYVATLRIESLPAAKRKRCKTSSAQPAIALNFAVIVLAVAALWSGDTFAAAPSDALTATAVREAGCKSLQSEIDRIAAAHADTPTVTFFQERLASLDNLADAVLQDLRLHHSAFLDQSLATVGGSTGSGDDTRQLLGASAIVEKYEPEFVEPFAIESLGRADGAVLQSYLKLASQTLTAFIQVRGRACTTILGANVSEIVRLSFVMELLVGEQNSDLSGSQPALPDWMSHPKELRQLQVFAIESGRPRIAFALARGSTTMAPADSSTNYLSFLRQQSDALLRTEKDRPALACLGDAINIATSIGKDTDVIEFSFRKAEVLEAMNSNQSAAELMAHVRSIARQPNDFGRASMLRLKYLHAYGSYDALASEALADLSERRCEGYLPQITYIAWATSRQQQSASTDSWRKIFLERFPDHALAADVYFTTATDALASGNYDEASRLLRFIEYRFPKSKIIDKVQKLQQTLDASAQSVLASDR